MIETISAWSISRLFVFESCRHRAYLQYLVKSAVPDLEDNHPMIRGRRIHEEVEHYINGATEDFPSSGKKLKELLNDCRDAYRDGVAVVEEQWGFDRNWEPVGWFADDVWLRMATDCTVSFDRDSANIFDWKTGKSFGNEVKYMQQMQLYAIGAFMREPELEYADVTLGFLDDGKTRTKSFERGAKLNKLITRFEERGRRMTECTDFRPNPNAMNCKYCPFGPTGTKACMYGVEPL